MTLAGTMAVSVVLVFQSAILGYRPSVLAYILVCLTRFRGRDEKGSPSRSCGAVPGNRGSASAGDQLASLEMSARSFCRPAKRKRRKLESNRNSCSYRRSRWNAEIATGKVQKPRGILERQTLQTMSLRRKPLLGNDDEKAIPNRYCDAVPGNRAAHADEFVVLLQRSNENPFVSFATMSWSCAEVLERHEANRVNGTWLMYDPPDGGQPSRIIWVGCLGAVSKMHCPTIAEKKDLKSGKASCQDRGYPQPGVKK